MVANLYPPFSTDYQALLLDTTESLISLFYKQPSLSFVTETLDLAYDSIRQLPHQHLKRHLQERSNKNLEIDYLKVSETDVYYDEQEDLNFIRMYYEDLNFSKDLNDILLDLTELLSKTHTTQLSYSTSRKALHSWVDLREDGQVNSIYSGRSLNPIHLMDEDNQTEEMAIRQMRQALFLETNLLSEHKELLIQAILRSIQYNIEHVIPQSWFKKKHPMVGDIHHLFTCEKDCNSFRGNIPYYDFEDYNPRVNKEVIKSDCGKRDANEKFEPENGKGEIARASLYFLLRYPDAISKEKQAFLDIQLYKRWHNEHPVTLHEKHRNWSIYKLQGNRNPFIDFPDLIFI